MSKDTKIVLSGVQPSGRPHIGNYFGAMKQFVELQVKHQCFFMIADYHALNSVRDAEIMRQNIFDVVADYLAIGLSSETSVIFKQSDIQEHTELAWIFEAITPFGYLERGHAYKDAREKGKEVSAGTFTYPMLMAADILLYDTDLVPVGQDQKQHVEYARDTAEKFNRIFGKGDRVFKLPEPLIQENVAVVPGIDGRKMSKSYGNTIPLFATDAEIEKSVMSIVTDSSGELPKNVFDIHKLFIDEEELLPIYENKKGKYKELKELLIEDLKKFISPLRKKREPVETDRDLILKTLKNGAGKAKAIASAKMDVVREKIGVSLR